MNKMINKDINIYIFILIIIHCISNTIYKIPIGLYNNKESINSEYIIDNLLYNLVYVNLSIGTPPQIIPFSLNINSQTFSAPNNLFIKNESTTYESLSKNEISYEYEEVSDGFNSKDILNLNNKNKFYFRNKIFNSK